MELSEIQELMTNPEKLIEPNQIVLLVQHISGFITHYEMDLDELNLGYSVEWGRVKYEPAEVPKHLPSWETFTPGKPLSDKQTDIKMMQTELYKNLMTTKRVLKQLGRFRSDLNRKLDIIMGIKRNK